MRESTRFVAAVLSASLVGSLFATVFIARASVWTVALWPAAAALVWWTSWSAIRCIKTLAAVDGMVGAILFDTQCQPTQLGPQEAIYARKLLALAQRYAIPCCVVAVAWKAPSQRAENFGIAERIGVHFDSIRCLKVLHEGLRTSDAIVSDQAGLCYVVCPFTSDVQASRLCERIRIMLAPLLSEQVTLAFAIAVFGEDGYSLEELVHRCEIGIQQTSSGLFGQMPEDGETVSARRRATAEIRRPPAGIAAE